VAALRAFGAREPDAKVRNPDSLVERLLTSTELELITEHPIAAALSQDYHKARQNPEVSGMSNLILIRTRYVDERMQRALNEGATQFVILGAGFDTRAYRFAEQLRGKKIFEVDYRSTQAFKKRRLVDVFGKLPEHVRFVEIDFKRDVLHDVLRAAGYEPGAKTFFIWEGVSYYLTEEAVRQTLRTIARESAPGSLLVMDFAEGAMIDMLRKLPHLSQHKYSTHWGEPWTYGLPDMREREFFRECGFEMRDILSLIGREAAKRYLTRSDGTSFGNARGAPPTIRRARTIARMIWMFVTRRSQWLAIADLVVKPE
jgi:methyltransferase (TIGR00027 family)